MHVPVTVADDDHEGWVELLADPLRAQRAYWHLLGTGGRVLPAIRAGLRHEDADVRMYCAKALDHLVDGIREGHATAVLAASIFHFGEFTIRQAKDHMVRAGLPMRLDP